MKKLSSLILALALVLALCACSTSPAAPSLTPSIQHSATTSPVAPSSSQAPEVSSDQSPVNNSPAQASDVIGTPTLVPSSTSVTGSLKVHFIDVGQGDSEFIELPNGQTMLIDAGNPGDGEDIASYITGLGYNTIDYLVATHPHADHIGGMPYLVKELNIESVYMPKASNNTQTFESLLLAIQDKGLKIDTAKAGVEIINTNDLRVSILAPNGTQFDDLNNYSAVIKITYNNNSFLFMGDAEEVSENEITADVSADVSVDVLKVGHHGSTSSTGQAFLNNVHPKYAVISVGADNDYGHPAQATLDKLEAIGATIYRTDLDSTVVFISNGSDITVKKRPKPDSSGEEVQTPAPATKVIISDVDKVGEIVAISNTGSADVNLKGWVLVSVKGDQRYTFPSYTLKTGATVTVASGDASGDLKWTTQNIWNNSSSDPAELYDSKGELVSTY